MFFRIYRNQKKIGSAEKDPVNMVTDFHSHIPADG